MLASQASSTCVDMGRPVSFPQTVVSAGEGLHHALGRLPNIDAVRSLPSICQCAATSPSDGPSLLALLGTFNDYSSLSG